MWGVLVSFFGRGLAVAGGLAGGVRAAFQNVGDVDVAALEAHGLDDFREELAGFADEGFGLRVFIGARGFRLATRQHLANGIMGYLASPLWMAQLLVGIVLVLQSHYIRPEYFTKEFSLFPDWPRFE